MKRPEIELLMEKLLAAKREGKPAILKAREAAWLASRFVMPLSEPMKPRRPQVRKP